MTSSRQSAAVVHVDDLGGSHSANIAMLELSAVGSVTSGSIMVPPGWFSEVAGSGDFAELDLGIHLTLTSESVAFRWSPLTTPGSAGGLVDDDQYLWPTVPEVRSNADPDAVDEEMRAQVDRALDSGLDITHLDHHMGVALAPEFVDRTVRIAADYRLPMLFPSNIAKYACLMNMGPIELEVIAEARREALRLGVAVADTFVMPLIHHDEAGPPTVRDAVHDVPEGLTYLSLHCAAPGDIAAIHPNDAGWRLAEYEALRDPAFRADLEAAGIELVGMAGFREALRRT